MTIYRNTQSVSDLAEVEVIDQGQANFAFFHARSDEGDIRLERLAKSLGQVVVSRASEPGGGVVLVTRGDCGPESLLAQLAGRNLRLAEAPVKRPFEAWKWRGRFSDVGQMLTLASSVKDFIVSGKPVAEDKLVFAALGLSANYVNKTYGAQKEDDVNRLDFLKTEINRRLAPYAPSGVVLPDIRATLNGKQVEATPPEHRTLHEKYAHFMRRNSVRVGEIGLRYPASAALIVPFRQFIAMGKKVAPSVKAERFAWARVWNNLKSNPSEFLNKDKANLWSGILYQAGRSLSLFLAVAPDPFDPKPKTAFTTFREKYAFRLSSLIEVAAAGTLGLGSLRKGDPIGALGGAFLATGLTTRYFAPYGVKEVNRKALYAYITDSLAKMPQDKLPELLSSTAAFLQDHFKDRPETFGEIYLELRNQLYPDRDTPVQSASLPSAHEMPMKFAQKLANPASGYARRAAQSPQATMAIG